MIYSEVRRVFGAAAQTAEIRADGRTPALEPENQHRKRCGRDCEADAGEFSVDEPESSREFREGQMSGEEGLKQMRTDTGD